MALHADTLWELRTTGNDDNGGGFYNRDPGTSVDYTQQDAAQLTLTDLTTDVAGTTLSSVTGGFTAAMAGNIINIKSGTGFTPGPYEITAYTDTNNVTIDRSAGSSATGGTGSVGGGRASFLDAFFETVIAGNTIWVKAGGTFTLTAAVAVAKDGTQQNYIKIFGYNSSRGDNPTEDNRPLIAAGAFLFIFDNYWEIYNLRVTTTESIGLSVDNDGRIVNCKSFNSSVSANRTAIRAKNTSSTVEDCEAISTNGYGIQPQGEVIGCNVHDSANGIYIFAETAIANCIIDTCTKGVFLQRLSSVRNCTIYNCTDAIYSNSNAHNNVTIKNNIIKDNTTGINYSGGASGGVRLDYNNFHGNDTDTVNVIKGDNTTSNDPEFIDAGNGDFSIGSAVTGTGSPGIFPGGLSQGYIDQGAVQASPDGGGGETAYGFVG
jgi:hypothetical protein